MGVTGLYLLYDLALLLLVPLGLAASLFSRRMSANLDRLPWRLGLGSYRELRAIEGSPRIWIHAASYGEVATLPRLVAGARERYPRACLAVSVMTATGLRAARRTLEGIDAAFYLPYDLPWVARRLVRAIRPDLFVTVETEIWPNYLRQARRFGARVLMVNGRISTRSFPLYLRLRGLFSRVLACYDRLAAIGRGDAERLVRMGAGPERVTVTGNMKFDLVIEGVRPEAAAILRDRLGLAPDAPVLVAGSTRPGEEEPLLEAYRALLAHHPDLRLVIAPRHIERAAAVAALVKAAGFTPLLRSGPADGGSPGDAGPRGGRAGKVIILDTMGELMAAYGLATLAFCGGSLVPLGGQNPLEPAAWGKVVLHGPHMENFPEGAALLAEAGAGLAVRDAGALAEAAGRLLADGEGREERGRAGREAVLAHGGASARNLAFLVELAGGSGSARPEA